MFQICAQKREKKIIFLRVLSTLHGGMVLVTTEAFVGRKKSVMKGAGVRQKKIVLHGF
jgi:hypothetical protein